MEQDHVAPAQAGKGRATSGAKERTRPQEGDEIAGRGKNGESRTNKEQEKSGTAGEALQDPSCEVEAPTLDRPLRLSVSKGPVTNTTLATWETSFPELAARMRKRPRVGIKDGPYFVRGSVDATGLRADEHIVAADLVVLDGDKGLDLETGELLSHAPHPAEVHAGLVKEGLQHVIATSHSHLDAENGRGPRYRVLLPTNRPMANGVELAACVSWAADRLHDHRIGIANAHENFSWSQPWFFPRLRVKDAPFESYSHEGARVLNVDDCVAWYLAREPEVALGDIEAGHGSDASPDSPIGRFLAAHDLHWMLERLEAAGYDYAGAGRVSSEICHRLLAPASESGKPGVIVFRTKRGRWRVISFHGEHDPLATLTLDGKRLAHDAFDLLTIFDYAGDFKAALGSLDARPVIVLRAGELDAGRRQIIAALAAQIPPLVFQRDVNLVRVARAPDIVSLDRHADREVTRIVAMDNADLGAVVTRIARFIRKKVIKSVPLDVAADPSQFLLSATMQGYGEWHGVPPLVGVTECPLMREDGSILAVRGYDRDTGLYLDADVQLNVPSVPTHGDAIAAKDHLLAPFAEFPIDGGISLSGVLALLFTLAQRPLMPTSPLFAVGAPTPASGKGLLVDACNMLVHGRLQPKLPSSGEGREGNDELRKKITSLLLTGCFSATLDEVREPLSGASLASALTSQTWSDRVLGVSRVPELPNRAVWTATGNGIGAAGDMVRRCILIWLDPECEHPEERTFAVPDLLRYVLRHRADLLTALFTILRAHVAAGRPQSGLTRLGSFETWSERVVAPILWLGLPSPVESQARLRQDDPEIGMVEQAFAAWAELFRASEVSQAHLVATAVAGRSLAEPEPGPAALLHEALATLAGDSFNINDYKLRTWLRRLTGRHVGGRVLLTSASTTARRYRLCLVAELRRGRGIT